MKKPIFIIIIIVFSALFFALSYRGIVYMGEKVKASEKPSEASVYKVTVVDVADTVPEDVEEVIDDYEYGAIDYSQYYDDIEPTGSTEDVIDETGEECQTVDAGDSTEAAQQPDEAELEDNDEFIIMTVQVGKGTLNLRQLPNKDAKIIYSLKNNSEVKVYPDSLTDGFYKIYVDDDTIGWASATYIK